MVKAARHHKRATRHDTVAAPMACHQPLVPRTRVAPSLVVMKHFSGVAPTVLLQRKATITKDARNHVQKQNLDVVLTTRLQPVERITWDVVISPSSVAAQVILKPLLVLTAKVAKKKSLLKHRRCMK